MLSGLENPVHLLILFAIILLVFGAKHVPEIGRSLGSGMREFKAGILGHPDLDAERTPPPSLQTQVDTHDDS